MPPYVRLIVGTLTIVALVHLFLTITTSDPPTTMSQSESAVAAQHAALVSGVSELLRLLVEMGYLEQTDISIPPHSDLPSEQIRSAGFEQDVVDLLSSLTLISKDVFENEGLDGDGIALAPSSSGISYLSTNAVERAREVNYPSGEVLPATVLKLTWGGRDIGKNIAYNMEDQTIAEWNPSDNGAHDWQSARRSPATQYLQQWTERFRTLEWLPWHDGLGYMVIPRPTSYDEYVADPSNVRHQMEQRHLSLSSMGLPVPSVDQMIDEHVEVMKSERNLYWSKRIVFEEAGWGESFDIMAFRRRCEDYEAQYRETTSLVRVGPKGQTIYDMQHGGQLRAWYRSMAGSNAV